MATGSVRPFWTRWRSRIHLARSSGVPCEALTRTTFTPASSSWAIRSGCDQAGPRVATILVRRMAEPGTKASTMGVGG